MPAPLFTLTLYSGDLIYLESLVHLLKYDFVPAYFCNPQSLLLCEHHH